MTLGHAGRLGWGAVHPDPSEAEAAAIAAALTVFEARAHRATVESASSLDDPTVWRFSLRTF